MYRFHGSEISRLLFTITVIILLVGSGQCKVINIIGGESIQKAIHEASSKDLIQVNSGTYYGNVSIDKSLSLIGIDTGGGMPILDARGDGNTITVNANGVRIEGFNVTNSGVYKAAIEINSKYNSIKNNLIYNNWCAINLNPSEGNSIENNFIAVSNWRGIYLNSSENNTIEGNEDLLVAALFMPRGNDERSPGEKTVAGGRDLYLHNSCGNIIKNNIFYKGITLNISSNNNSILRNIVGNEISAYNSCDNNSILYNTVNDTIVGIGLYIHCDRNDIRGNHVNDSAIGIGLYSSCSDNIITYNNVSDNYGSIDIYYCNNNIIFMNNFKDNHSVQTAGQNNIWFSPTLQEYRLRNSTFRNHVGNHWTDYKGIDANGDGLGDTPYIKGEEKDKYPLLYPFEDYGTII
jgi:parallel beta-helix repeat protein